MTKVATPCFTPRIPSASISTITIHTETQSVCEDLVETHLCKLCVILRSHVFYYGVMHVVAEAGSVRACQLLRREHAANIWPSLCWPGMLGWVETSRNALEMPFRGQTKGSVCVDSDVSNRNIPGIWWSSDSDSRKKRRNGEETTKVVSSPLFVCINLLALLYFLHA